MEEIIDFYNEYYKPMFEEGCRIWIDGIRPYLEIREDKSIWFCPPIVKNPVQGTNTTPVRIIEGKPEHNFFCQRGCYKRLDFDGRKVECKRCGYINSLRKYLAERIKIIEQSVLENSEEIKEIMKSRRWENGVEIEFKCH